ncbi:hypothetical protein GN956_G17756 [Arapaima gigas]
METSARRARLYLRSHHLPELRSPEMPSACTHLSLMMAADLRVTTSEATEGKLESFEAPHEWQTSKNGSRRVPSATRWRRPPLPRGSRGLIHHAGASA